MKLKDIVPYLRGNSFTLTLNAYYANGVYYSFMTVIHKETKKSLVECLDGYGDYELMHIDAYYGTMYIEIKEVLDSLPNDLPNDED